MKTVKLSVFAIGVALSVAPFFNSAKAQSPTDSAAILLELQTLRSEIADLRDMVERQQFELKKLKRAGANAVPNRNTAYNSPNDGVTANGLPQSAYSSQQQGAYSSQQPSTYSSSAESGYQNQQNPGQQTFPNQQNSSNQAGQRETGGFDNLPPSSGRPRFNDGEASAREYIDRGSNDPLSAPSGSGVEVVDRSFDASGADRQYSANGTEIIERGIEGYAGPAAAPVLSSDSNYNASANSADSASYNNAANGQRGVAGSQPPAQVNRPVLAVPNEAVTTANQAAPQQQASIASQFTEDQYYDRGFDFLKQSKYNEAINVFKQQIDQYPQGDLADDAHYWVAEALFIDRKPAEAKPHLRAIIDNYPQSARLPDAMLKTAYIEQDLGNVIEARILLQEIVAKHPSSNAAIAAKNRLENLKSGG